MKVGDKMRDKVGTINKRVRVRSQKKKWEKNGKIDEGKLRES